MDQSTFIVSLRSITDRDGVEVGGKALGLARLIKAGYPVPTGFCVTTRAYRVHLAAETLAEPLDKILAGLEGSNIKDKRKTLGDIRCRIVGASLSKDLVAELREAYRALEPCPLAVRSSATAEDLGAHSFAGQYETALGVRSLEDCLEAVKRCWASVWTDRAFEYRRRNGIDHAQVEMAVILQSLVDADASGVLFTADPVTGRSDRIVIEACLGLGDLLVSGHVTPDRFAVAKDSLKVISQSIAEKKVKRVMCADGALSERPVAAAATLAPAVDQKTIARLAKLGRRAERDLGGPQDMEWAVTGSDISVLQSRPITTLRRTKRPPNRYLWSSFPAREVMPDVVTPVTMSIVDSLGDGIIDPLLDAACVGRAGIPLYQYCAGRLYFNASFWVAVIRAIARTRRYDFARDAGSNPALIHIAEKLKDISDEDLPKIEFHWIRLILKLPVLTVAFLRNTPKRGDAIIKEIGTRNQKWERLDPSCAPTEQLVDGCHGVIADFRVLLDSVLYLFATLAAFLMLDSVCAKWFSDRNLARRLVAGIGNLDDAAAAMDLWHLAAKANGLPELREALLEEKSWSGFTVRASGLSGADAFFRSWDKFMARHGHHCRGELELHNPRWSESPDYVLGLICGYLACIDQTDPIENHRKLAEQRRLLEQQCRRRLKNPIKRAIFNFLLGRSQYGATWRENEKSEAIKVLTTLRKLLLELGRRLHAEGTLAGADDVFFLKLEDLRPVVLGQATFDIKQVVAARRAEHARHTAVTPPDLVAGEFDPDRYVPEEIDAQRDVLNGLAVSPGQATGTARVILRADSDQQVRPGEILVAPFTDPGWTPYFLPAAGVVMDQGSLLSHGSIVARELGIPAVTNVGHATRIIKTGQTVHIDGDRGTVTILDKT